MDVQGPVPTGQLTCLARMTAPAAVHAGHCCQENGNFCVCKVINLKEKTKIPDILPMTFTKPFMVDWKNNVKYMKKFVFENLGGFQCRHHVLRGQEEGEPDAEKLKRSGTLASNTSAGKMSEIGNSGGLLFKHLPAALPSTSHEKSIRNLATDGVLAQMHEAWPLTLFDIDGRAAPLSEKAISASTASLGLGKLQLPGRLPRRSPGTTSSTMASLVKCCPRSVRPVNLIFSEANAGP